jgi:lipopolysaccharide transport system ATP-binding protein
MTRIIELSNVSKGFQPIVSTWSLIKSALRTSEHKTKTSDPLSWVLKDINLTVEHGQSIGIIGRNGAGKSTLLKLMTGILNPTMGTVTLRGNVAAILELGLGLHPEFSGASNAELVISHLHPRWANKTEVIERIMEFSELRERIHDPIRTYSTGMTMRLAFSIVTAIRPDILIIDEALAVGDIGFQRKCFALIESFRKQGTTLIFVSHDPEAIKRLCDRAIYLRDGTMYMDGDPKAVVGAYERDLFTRSDSSIFDAHFINTPQLVIYDKPSTKEEYGDGRAKITETRLLTASGALTSVFTVGSEIILEFDVEVEDFINGAIFSLMVKTKEGLCVYYCDSLHLATNLPNLKRGDRTRTRFSLKNNLSPGSYWLNCAIRSASESGERIHWRIVDCERIQIVTPHNISIYPGGICNLEGRLSIEDRT